MPTPQKEMTVSGLVEILDRTQAAIVADYRGLTVEQLANLRKRLRPLGARFVVDETQGEIEPQAIPAVAVVRNTHVLPCPVVVMVCSEPS